MELRHLRYFVVLAEELHFSRAAVRLHIEQSPLSRSIKELEAHLGAELFHRSRRGTRLTWAGQVLLRDAMRLFSVLEQAKANVCAAANGYRGTIRIAISDGIAQARLAPLLALCREEEPEVEIRLFEASFTTALRGLREDHFDIGLAQSNDVCEGVRGEALWCDQIFVAIPRRHPLLAYRQVTLENLLCYPLIMFHPKFRHGAHQQVAHLLSTAKPKPKIAEYVTSMELMSTLVEAGYGLGFMTASQTGSCRSPELIMRPLATELAKMTTYFLHPDKELSAPLLRFIDRAKAFQSSFGSSAIAGYRAVD